MIKTDAFEDTPEAFYFTFEAKNIYTIQEIYFEEISYRHTKWTRKNKFKCKGLTKVTETLIPKAFDTQTFCCMKDFETFAKQTKSILHN